MMDHGYHNHADTTDDPKRLRESGVRVGVMVFMALFFALMAPAGLGLATFSSLTSLAAIVVAVMGTVHGEQLAPERLTRWDEAAALMLISMLSGALVDLAAVESAVATAG
ncbi:MAG: hypothetical protein GVY13_03475 [Alphaproteobacteria bacterium]|jgi:uncharacterized membrane protein YcaP (DUF421 family)|nr:hypothetical protein [Alphaproteobacteria bacterium]